MAPQVRLELTTLRLTAECSAIELLRIIRGLFAARLPADGSLFSLVRLASCAQPWPPPRLRCSPGFRSLPRSSLCSRAGKTSVPPAPCGSRQLPTLPSRSQLSTISVWRLNFCVRYGYRWCPPAIVTGNFPWGAFPLPVRFASLFASASRTLRFLAPPPRTFKTAQVRVDQQTPHSPSSSLDQALDRLVSASSTPHSASTADLSTSSSLRGLTCSRQWQSSSSGGLHA